MTIKGEVRGALMKRWDFYRAWIGLPMGRWLPYSTCQSCTWQRECRDGAAHCSHSWVTPWPWIYIFPVHWENTQTHKSCHTSRQRQIVAPEVQVELLCTKRCTPDFNSVTLTLSIMTQLPNCIWSTQIWSVHTQKNPGFWNTSRHLNQKRERDAIERHCSHATEPSNGSETTSCSAPVAGDEPVGGGWSWWLYLTPLVDLLSQDVSRVIYNYGVLILRLLIAGTVGPLLRISKQELKTTASIESSEDEHSFREEKMS